MCGECAIVSPVRLKTLTSRARRRVTWVRVVSQTQSVISRSLPALTLHVVGVVLLV